MAEFYNSIVRSTDMGKLPNQEPAFLKLNEEGDLKLERRVQDLSYVPVIQNDFTYGINSGLSNQYSYGLGVASGLSGLLVCSAGPGVDSMGSLVSKRRVRCQPGQSMLGVFSAILESGTAGNNQLVGFGDQENGIFFGTIGTQFGIIRKSFGVSQYATLTINSGSLFSQNATVTLNGSGYTVATTSGTAATTTFELSNFDYGKLNPGWEVAPVGSTVVFKSLSAEPLTGLFRLDFTLAGPIASGNIASGVFTQTVTGATGSTEIIPQTSWNVDVMDGSAGAANPSTRSLDINKGNVYAIEMNPHFGAMNFYIADSENGKFNKVHTINYGNRNLVPSLSNYSLPFYISSKNTTNTSKVSVKCGFGSAFVKGDKRSKTDRNKTVTKTSVGTGLTPLFSIRNGLFALGNKSNQLELALKNLVISNIGTKGAEIYLIEDGVLNNTASFAKLSAASSMVEVDTAATSVTGGIELQGIGVSNLATLNVDLNKLGLKPNGLVTVAAKAVASTTDLTVSLNWEEE